MTATSPHAPHHRPADADPELDPGLLPIEPDLGPVPPGLAGEGQDDGVIDAEV